MAVLECQTCKQEFHDSTSYRSHHCQHFRTMLIWKFEDAPPFYQSLSGNGGDEDWICFVPDEYMKKFGTPYFLQSGTPFGICDVQEIKITDGTIFVGCHA